MNLSPSALKSKIVVYLEENKLPSISSDQMEELESDFSIKKLQSAIQELKTAKSSGPDDYTGLYYTYCFYKTLS